MMLKNKLKKKARDKKQKLQKINKLILERQKKKVNEVIINFTVNLFQII